MTAKTAEYVNRIPCKSSQKVYTAETGRSFEVIIKEQEKEVELEKGRKYTKSIERYRQNKFVITHHFGAENHVIIWDQATIVSWWIKTAVKILRKSRHHEQRSMAYQLSHVSAVATSGRE